MSEVEVGYVGSKFRSVVVRINVDVPGYNNFSASITTKDVAEALRNSLSQLDPGTVHRDYLCRMVLIIILVRSFTLFISFGASFLPQALIEIVHDRYLLGVVIIYVPSIRLQYHNNGNRSH